MKHTIIALAAAGLVAAAVPSSAQAGCGGCGVAAGVVGGLAAGAIIGGAAAGPYGYGYGPYGYGGGYYASGPYYGAYAAGGCGWRRERVWDGYGYRIRRVRVCY
jgi:hypothetical protein